GDATQQSADAGSACQEVGQEAAYLAVLVLDEQASSRVLLALRRGEKFLFNGLGDQQAPFSLVENGECRVEPSLRRVGSKHLRAETVDGTDTGCLELEPAASPDAALSGFGRRAPFDLAAHAVAHLARRLLGERNRD